MNDAPRGLAVVDTFYEYLGYSLCEGVDVVLRGLWIPFAVALCGCVHACIRASERGEPKAVAGYLLYLVLMTWLLAPIPIGLGTMPPEIAGRDGVPVFRRERNVDRSVPRLLHRGNEAVDALLRPALRKVDERFAQAPFEWERIARMVSIARIRDTALLLEYRAFLKGCYERMIARLPEGQRLPDPLDPSSVPRYTERDSMTRLDQTTSCREAVTRIRRSLQSHLKRDLYHRSVVAAAKRHDGGSGFEEAYLRTLSIAEWHAGGGIGPEAAQVVRSVGDPVLYEVTGDGFWDHIRDFFGMLSRVKQEWNLLWEPGQKYYLIALFGPHLYGFTLMLLLGLFPVVAVWAVAPGGWKALANFGKVYVSVKMWPLVWAALSKVGAARTSLETVGDGPAGIDMRHVWMAAAGMYLLTPALTFLIVQLATRAAAAGWAQAVPSTAGTVSPVSVLSLDRRIVRR